jgi:hypothetical protein
MLQAAPPVEIKGEFLDQEYLTGSLVLESNRYRSKK